MPGRFAADFETTTKPPVRVWAWGIADTDTPEQVEIGDSMDGFFEWMQEQKKNPTIYFHNEKFDGAFILYYLLTHGYTWKKTRGDCCGMDFTTIIDNFGKFFAIEIYWKRKGKRVKKATIYDSFKLVPMSVEKAAGAFGLKTTKLDIDYDRHNDTGVKMSPLERLYIEHDVSIVAQILQKFFSAGLQSMTIGACAVKDYKATIGDRNFWAWFPETPYEIDQEMREAYLGGWMYVNPQHKGLDVGTGYTLDVNALYPYIMHDKPLPWGIPVSFSGQYEDDPERPLYIQRLVCSFRLKPGKLPTIQLRNTPSFMPAEYATKCDQLVELCLSSVDLALFFEHYDVFVSEWRGGWKFYESDKMFKPWVDKWQAVKEQADRDGNEGLRQIAKLIMVNLYGKFSTNPKRQSKMPVYSKIKDLVEYMPIETPCTDEFGQPVLDEHGHQVVTTFEIIPAKYVALSIFVTAWGRDMTIRAAQRIHEESLLRNDGESVFCYANTDSLHLIGDELPDFLEIDPHKLGAWKVEYIFTRARFLNPNRYILDNGHSLKVRCSGLSAEQIEQVTFENFKPGAIYSGKLVPRVCPGGVVLRHQIFTLH